MSLNDAIVIDPTPLQFVEMVRTAARRIVAYYPRFGDFSISNIDALELLSDIQHRPDGWFDWEAEIGRRTRTGIVRVIWWTDHLGRKHLRVNAQLPADDDQPLGPHRPPLLALYPRAIVTQHRFGRMHLLGVCDCGAWGEPAALAWMGPLCGPCHDREEQERFVPDHWQAGQGQVRRLAFSSDGHLAVAADDVVTVWSLSPPCSLGTWGWGAAANVTSLEFSPDGRLLAWESESGAHLVECGTGREWAQLFMRFAFHPDGRGIFLFTPPTTLELWEIEGWKRKASYHIPNPLDLTRLSVSGDGRLLAGTTTGWLLIWDVQSGELRQRVPRGTGASVLLWLPGRPTLAVGGADGMRFWGPTNCPVIPEPITQAHAMDNGRWLVVQNQEGLQVWNVITGAMERSVHADQMTTWALSAPSRLLAFGTRDGRVRVIPADVLWNEKPVSGAGS